MGQDPVEKELTQRAAEMAAPYLKEVTIVRRLLESDDPKLHYWGLRAWPRGLMEAAQVKGYFFPQPPPPLTPATEPWHAMLPRIRLLAETSPYYDEAIKNLCDYREENVEFLRGLIPRDKSAWKIYRLLDATIMQNMYEAPMLDPLFNEQLLRLLNDPDPAPRKDALGFIIGTHYTAEMFWIHFTPAVASRVEELLNSADFKERRDAASAVDAMRELKPRLAEYDKKMGRAKWWPAREEAP